MGIQVDVTDGNVTPPGSELTPGTNFEWVNNTSSVVQITNCGNWLTASDYLVQPNGGTTAAQVQGNPNTNGCAFKDTGWDAPGMPHIIISPWHQKEVA
jgi:hypothetical protein